MCPRDALPTLKWPTYPVPRHSQVRNGPNVTAHDYACSLGLTPFFSGLQPFAFLNVRGWEERKLESTSIHNPVEAAVVALIVESLSAQHKDRLRDAMAAGGALLCGTWQGAACS